MPSLHLNKKIARNAGRFAMLCLALLPLEVLADPPLVESPPLKMVDGIDRFKRRVFLKNATLITSFWADNRRIIAKIPSEPDRNPGHPELPLNSWVMIDTETGAVERMPWRMDDNPKNYIKTHVNCVAGRRIILNEYWLNASGTVTITWMVGELGGELKRYVIENTHATAMPPEWTREGLEIGYCELTKWPTHVLPKREGHLIFMAPGHGWVLRRDSYEIKNEGDEPLVWIKPDGSKVSIPLTAGESVGGGGSFIEYENAYFLQPGSLIASEPNKKWTPQYARLLHLDGRIDLFPVPEPIMKLLRDNPQSRALANARYSRRGPLWYYSGDDQSPDFAGTLGYYLINGNELVRVLQRLEAISPDGCKLLAESERTASQLRNPKTIRSFTYSVINLCKDN